MADVSEVAEATSMLVLTLLIGSSKEFVCLPMEAWVSASLATFALVALVASVVSVVLLDMLIEVCSDAFDRFL